MTSRAPFALLLCALFAFAAPQAAAQCVSLTTLGSASTQNFNTLSNTAGSTTNNLTITGWFMTETGGGARDNEQYAVDTGGSNTGDSYSYGAAGNTDRAFGGLRSGTLIPVKGACFTNNSGSTISSLDVAYTGEQWRLGNTAAARDDRLDFQYSLNATSLTTGTWTDVDALDFTNPIKTAAAAGALDGNNAANRTAISQSIPSLSIANGATFWVRWNDLDASGADDGLAIDDFSLTPQGAGPVVPALNISDVSLSEGDPPGTTTFTFAVTLTAPAGPGGVTFDIATADGTAQDDVPATEDNDYVANSLTGQTIPAGSTGPYTFDVTVNHDTATEPNETFFVNVTNITGANAGDVQGLGTILNDDVTLTPIHDIQGPGASSPIVGASVTTRGIVTGLKSNGFFIQEPDATVDADPATSEGVFVFTSAAPPAAATLGNLVQVTATVVEFVPSQDPLQPPLTELSSPTVVELSTGNPLPAPVALTTTFPDPAGPHDQLERVEGMRVSVASLTVISPTDGNVSEPNATSTSTGDFYGVVTGLPRPFREPGIQAPDPAPAGSTIPPIPRWDANPEALRVDNGLVGSPVLNVSTGAVVTGLVGPLDYGFRRYTILPEPAPTPVPTVTGGMTPTSAAAATSREFTVGGYNLERFFDTVNDPAIGEPVLTPTAFETRLNKASLGIRNRLGTPDIVGIVEIENLTTLQTLATRINDDAVAASQPDPQYVGYLVEGNDVGDIDVGLLVKTATVYGATPRVTVNAVVQELDGSLFVNPDFSTEELHDRPPLRLDAVINHPNGASFPVTVIVVHNRSLNDAESEDPGSDGWPTKGTRVRAKRLAQAEDIANLIQMRQTADPAESIIVLGDFNAFEFNDGYVDAMNVITGTPPPDDETAVAGDGIDLVNPDLDNLFDSSPLAERYSFVFGGQAQNLDHLLVNQGLINGTVARRLEHPRINSDFPEIERNDGTTALRLADHDPLVGFFEVAAFATSDVSVTKTDNVDPVNAGQNFFYTITVDNAGPDPADTVSWSDALPAETTFVSLSAPGGWTCTTPAVGANGTVTCSIPSLGVTSAAFSVTVAVNAGLTSGTTLSNTATVTTATADANPANNSATETTGVLTSADLVLSKTDTPDPVSAGSNLSYQITMTNNGPSVAADATFSDTLPAGTTFVSLSTTGPWSCTTPAVGASGTVTCTNAGFGVTVDFFTIVVQVDPNVASGTTLSNTATLASSTPDPNGANNSATATTTVVTSADLQVTKVDTPDPVTAGNTLTYTINLANAGPSDAAGVILTDTIPANTTFVSLTSFADFNCTTPAVGGTGLITCTKPTAFPSGANGNFTLVVAVDGSTPSGTVLSNTATVTATTVDPNGANNSATATTTTGAGSADVSVTKSGSPDPVDAGASLTYTITVANAGPSDATTVALSDALPTGTMFASLVAPAGWTCTTPAVGATGSIDCSIASLGITSAVFTLTVDTDPALLAGTVLTNTATVTSATTDPNGANDTAVDTTTVTASADLLLSKTDTPDPVDAGSTISYQLTLTNNGPSHAADATLTDTLPAGTTFVSLSTTGPWTCTTPAVGATGTIDCTNASFGVTVDFFTLVVEVDPGLASGTVLTNTATLASTATDANPANNTATATTTVGVGSADISITKSVSPNPVNAGADLAYTITVTNAGPTNAASTEMTDTLPAGTTFVSLDAPAGWTCTTPAVGAAGSVSCTNPSLSSTSAVFTLTARVAADTPSGTTLSNTASVSSTTADPNPGDESATATASVLSPANVTGTKSVTGTFEPNGSITYTIVLTNSGPSTQEDNAGDELVDILPASLTLVSATATSGTALATVATNTVTWNGSIASGASVTLTINAVIESDVTPGTTISNQATIAYDADGNGSNESSGSTDSPTAGGSSDPTDFVVVAAPAIVTGVPTLDEYALMALAALLAAVAMMMLKR